MAQVPPYDINDDGEIAISAQVEEYLNALRDAVNNLDEENVNPSSQIAILNQDETVTGNWTFDNPPTINGTLDESAIPHTFANAITANGGISTNGLTLLNNSTITNLRAEVASSLPVSGQPGQIIYDTSQNKLFVWNGTDWVDLTYTGTYTGGALRTYTGEVLIDDDNSKIVLFKVDSSSTVAKVFLQGARFPTTFYRELPYHTHGLTGASVSVSIDDPGHSHDVVLGSHTHSGTFASGSHTHTVEHRHYINLTTSTEGAHDHGGFTGETTAASGTATHKHTISSDGDHSHSVSGYTDYGEPTTSAPSATASVGSTDLGTKTSESATTGITASASISGDTDAAGVNGGTLSTSLKTYPDSIQVKLNGNDITSIFLSATGWSQMGDGTDTHDFVASGTGEVEIWRKVTGEVVGTGDGTTTSFSHTNSYTPVQPNSVTISYTIGGTDYTATDDGAGNISGTNLSGTINYTTGEVSLTFTTAPDSGKDITENYQKGYCTTGINRLEVIEPTAGEGGAVLYHIDVS